MEAYSKSLALTAKTPAYSMLSGFLVAFFSHAALRLREYKQHNVKKIVLKNSSHKILSLFTHPRLSTFFFVSGPLITETEPLSQRVEHEPWMSLIHE